MDVDVSIQIAVEIPFIPEAASFREWVRLALEGRLNREAEVTIRIVDVAEMTALNQRFRGKNAPTNVLSFPFVNEFGEEEVSVGDIAICAPVVIQEARAQGKTERAHFAHLTLHGVLHLLGYDHQLESDAKQMESLEIQLLQQLGFNNPYA